jgi:hypothetical protein
MTEENNGQARAPLQIMGTATILPTNMQDFCNAKFIERRWRVSAGNNVNIKDILLNVNDTQIFECHRPCGIGDR